MKKICILLLIIPTAALAACSIFSLEHNGKFYLAGNEDYVKMKNSIRFVPANDKEYAYALMAGSSYIETYPQIAINEKGLAVDWATVPRSSFVSKPDLPTLETPLIPELMKFCKNVDEVIQFVQNYNIPHFAYEHLFVADAEGRSIVLEWHENKLAVIAREGSYQLATNFNLLKPESGYYPCYRFDAGKVLLESGPGEDSDLHLRAVLEAMHSSVNYPTLYSYVFDLKEQKITLYNFHDFTKKAELSLALELEKGFHTVAISDLTFE